MVKVRESELSVDWAIAEPAAALNWLTGDQPVNPLLQRVLSDAIAQIQHQPEWQPLLARGLELAETLIQLHADQETLAAALLYPAVQQKKLPLSLLRERYGSVLARLVRGAGRMNLLRPLPEGSNKASVDNLRKMLLAMIDDVRVVLLRLAEQALLLRAARQQDDESRRVLAQQTMDIYAPLANRLGIGQLKWELEDLAFHYLQPRTYKKIAQLLDEKRLDRERFIDKVLQQINHSLAEEGISAQVYGRPKHIYSIWRKMKRKGIDFSEVYDVRAVRVTVDTLRDCYAVLGIVHGLWQHIPKEFDDYIATPKENGYQSLHTAVIGPEGKVVEIQIRTQKMHQDAELGVAAHWRYKEAGQVQVATVEHKIAWLRQLLAWQDELSSDGNALYEALQNQVFEERVYVFTPRGDVVDLPNGSTPLDFAYAVHTDVGHRCRGAKVNGRIVPLNYSLKTGEQIEILTGNQLSPSRDWLNVSLGYIYSSSARSKIQHWFRLQAREQNQQEGRLLFDKEWQRLALGKVDYQALAQKLGFETPDDLFGVLGSGDIKLQQVLKAAEELVGVRDLMPVSSSEPPFLKPSIRDGRMGKDEITIQGVGNLLTQMAGCCKPLPGDPIVGYITQSRGVMVHQQGCAEVLQLKCQHPERLIEVEWGAVSGQVYPVDIGIHAYDRQGLLRDITTVLATEKINVIGLQTHSNKKNNTAMMIFTVEIEDLSQMGTVLNRISQLPNVIEARRKHGERG